MKKQDKLKCPKCLRHNVIGYSAMYDHDKPWHYDGVIAWCCRDCFYWWPREEIKEWVEFVEIMRKEDRVP